MRAAFDMQLDNLKNEMILASALCENYIKEVSNSLIYKDLNEISGLKKFEGEVANKEKLIENICLTIFLQQQPVANDLRTVTTALKMITDIRRISDHSGEIVEIIETGNVKLNHSETLKKMIETVLEMVNKSIDAYVKKDMELAKQIIKKDDIVDEYFEQMTGEVIDNLKKQNQKVKQNLDLFIIAKYYERIADHCVNIAIWVCFLVTGKIEDEKKLS